MFKLKTTFTVIAALTLSVTTHAEQELNEIYHVLNYSCYKTEESSGIVEYCTPVHTDSVENFNVPMGGYITSERQVEIARDYAKKKDAALKKSK